jgi:hypothetical protein
MPVTSTPLGPVIISGKEAQAFTEKLRNVKVSFASVKKGRDLVAEFNKNGVVAIVLDAR